MLRIIPACIATILGLALALPASAGKKLAPASTGDPGAASVPLAAKTAPEENPRVLARYRAEQTEFFHSPLLDLNLTIPEEGIKALREEPRHYVEGVLEAKGKPWKMTVKLKGAEGSFRPIDEKPCFTLNFGKGETSERFHGFRKAHLNNAREDPSFLRQQLCGEIVRAAGIPAIRCTHAWVKLNGRDLGLYVFTEAYTPDLLAPFFSNPNGDLYESGFCKDIDQDLTKGLGDPRDFKAIDQLLQACREDEPGPRWKKLSAILDTDRFATFLSMESLLAIGDSYDFFRNNYRIYHDPKTNRLSFIPHGMDEPLKEPEFEVRRSPDSIVGRAFVDCPEGRALYRARIGELFFKILQGRDWPGQLDAARARVISFAAKHDPDFAKDLRGPQQVLKDILIRRLAYAGDKLGDTSSRLVFNKSGSARLPKSWFNKEEGDAAFDRNKNSLVIRAEGECQASWRLALELEPGRYRFQGTAQIRDVHGAGVGLRISGKEPEEKWATGSVPDESLSYEFDAPESGEVVLVAELRATHGEVSFPLETLRLVRVKK